jgi:hypothetical protein
MQTQLLYTGPVTVTTYAWSTVSSRLAWVRRPSCAAADRELPGTRSRRHGVRSAEKHGVDAGVLVGIDPVGIAATTSVSQRRAAAAFGVLRVGQQHPGPGSAQLRYALRRRCAVLQAWLRAHTSAGTRSGRFAKAWASVPQMIADSPGMGLDDIVEIMVYAAEFPSPAA